MTEIVLLLVIIALVGLIGWMDWNNRKERKSFLNALKAKDNQELVNLELADKTKIETKPEESPDLVPLETLSDEEYEEKIVSG